MVEPDESAIIAAFLERYVDAGDTHAAPALNQLGDFELLREIGRGGMGVVFEARQVSLDRRVAVKVLRSGHTTDASHVARFRREAAAAGQVRHPGIVPIYVVDEVDGCHYYAMEFVAGRNLADHLQTVAAAAGGDPNRLESTDAVHPRQPTWITEAAEIAAQAVDALAAAHAEGLVHRDVKPQNVMIDADGHVRLVDFGLARHLDAVQLTRTGEVAGTPRYMSPEQFDGRADLDHRTDVFSLGVVLYELITLSVPFDGETTQELLRAIALLEPTPPRVRNPRVPRDLETICLKAIEKEPARRYEDAAALGADLRRFLIHEPILARPPGPFTRVMKLVRRHRAASIATVLAILLVIVGPLVFGVYMGQARETLAKEQEKTLAQRNRARDTLAEARQLIARQLEAVRPLRTSPDARATYERVVKDALDHYGKLLAQAEGDDEPAMLREVAAAAALVAKLHGDLGELDDAIQLNRRAAATLEQILATPAGTERDRIARATALDHIFNDRRRRGDPLDDSERDVATAIDLLESVLAVDLHDTTTIDARAKLAAIYARRALARLAAGNRRAEADRDAARAMEIWRSLPLATVASAPNLAAKTRLHCAFAEFERSVGRIDVALEHGEVAVDTSRELVRVDSNPETLQSLAAALMAIGTAHAELGAHEAALAHFDEGLALARDLVAKCPTEVGLHALLANMLFNTMLLRLDDGTDLRPLLAEAVILADSLVQEVDADDEHRMSSARIHDIGALIEQHRNAPPDTIRQHYRSAVEVLQPLVDASAGPEVDARLAATLSNSADFELLVGAHEAARAAIERAITAQQRALAANPDNPNYRQFLRNMRWVQARTLVRLGDPTASANAVTQMLALSGRAPQAQVFAAQILSDCAACVRRDEATADPARSELASAFGQRAVQCLDAALDAGWRPRRDLADAPRFAPLRDVPGFAEAVVKSHR